MKNNLVKLLAVGALIASLGACGKPGSKDSGSVNSGDTSDSSDEVPEVVDIGQFYEVIVDEDTLDVYAALDGKLVTLEGHTIIGYHGRTVYTSYTDGDKITNLHGVEFRLAEGFEFDWASAQRDMVNVTGRVAYENGVCVLNDATYVVTTEGVYTQGSGWNNPAYYCPGEAIGERSDWDNFTSNYQVHCVVSEGTFQLATAPTWVDGKDTTFYVVFPGEDRDVENPDNTCPIKVTVPGDLVAAKRDIIKGVLDTVAVGEFFYTMFLFNSSAYGTGLMLDNYWGAGWIEKVTDVDIITEYADAAALAADYYVDPIPDLGIDEYALSYSVNTSYWNEPLTEIWKDPTALGFTADQIANWAFTVWNVNVSASSINAAIEAFGAKMVAAGFESAGSEDGTTIWVASEGEGDDEVETAVVFEFDGPSNIQWYYVAARGEGPAQDEPGEVTLDGALAEFGCTLYNSLTGKSLTADAYKTSYVKFDTSDNTYWCGHGFEGASAQELASAAASILNGAKYPCVQQFAEDEGWYIAFYAVKGTTSVTSDTIIFNVACFEQNGVTYIQIVVGYASDFMA